MKPIILVLIFLSKLSFGVCQNAIQVSYPLEIESNYNQYDEQCSSQTLSLTLPAGSDISVDSVFVEYEMTARNGAWISQQLSRVRFLNNLTYELNEASGPFIEAEGTNTYSRFISIANGSYNGGTILNFELQAARLYGGSGCNTTYNSIDAGSWAITVWYSKITTVGINTVGPLSSKFEINGVIGAGNTAAAFGTKGAGITFQRSPATLGFNQYNDNKSQFGKYMKNGFSSQIKQGAEDIIWNTNSEGLKDQNIASSRNALIIDSSYPNYSLVGINVESVFPLDFEISPSTVTVGYQPGNTLGTVVIQGSEYTSNFNQGSAEDTYIRGGTTGSKLYLNDEAYTTNNYGQVGFKGFNSVGNTANNYPNIALEINGALALTKHLIYKSKGAASDSISITNCSYVDIVGVNSSNQPTNGNYIVIKNGLYDLKIITALNSFTLQYQFGCQNNGCPPKTVSMNVGDVLTLYHDEIISFSDN